MTAYMRYITEVFGWYGVAAVFSAYAAASFGVLSADGVAFQLLNITGGAGIMTVSLAKRAYQPAALNLIWTAVGIVALVRAFL